MKKVNPDTPPAEPPIGWRIVIQREENGGATIFYSGEIPDLKLLFRLHKRGVKVFHADPENGVSIAFIDQIFVPKKSEWLAKSLEEWRKKGFNWREMLMPYDILTIGNKIDTKRVLSFGETGYLFRNIIIDFEYRSLKREGQSLSSTDSLH